MTCSSFFLGGVGARCKTSTLRSTGKPERWSVLVVGADTIRIGESIRHRSSSASLHERTTLIQGVEANPNMIPISAATNSESRRNTPDPCHKSFYYSCRKFTIPNTGIRGSVVDASSTNGSTNSCSGEWGGVGTCGGVGESGRAKFLGTLGSLIPARLCAGLSLYNFKN